MYTRLPNEIKTAANFIASATKNKYRMSKSDALKLAEARMTVAVYGCKKERLPITVENLTLILGKDAASTFKVITPDFYSTYGIINEMK